MFGVHALNGRHVAAGEAEVTVGVVLQNDEVVLACQLVQPLPLFQRHHSAGGVLEIGNDIDQLRALACLDGFFHCCQVHAVLFHGNANQIDTVGTERIQGADKAGGFAEQGVTAVQQHFAGKLICLLGTGGGDEVVCICIEALLCSHTLFQQIAEFRVSLRDVILQRQNRVFFEQFCGDLPNGVYRKRLRSRIAGGKRDHTGHAGEFQNFTNRRGLQCVNIFCKFVLHGYILPFGQRCGIRLLHRILEPQQAPVGQCRF